MPQTEKFKAFWQAKNADRVLRGKEWIRYPVPAKTVLRDRLLTERFRRTYYEDPVAFVHDCFEWKPGEGPNAYQDEILSMYPASIRVAVRGPHGIGKTAMIAWLVHWFALTRDTAGVDWKMPTTASVWRQLSNFLWPEIHKWARALQWEQIGRAPYNERTELQTLQLNLATGSAFAVASDTPSSIEGTHADSVFYIFDEAKTIPSETFDAAEGAFSGAGPETKLEAFGFAGSTPGEPLGRFAEIHQRKPGLEAWRPVHVTLDQAIQAGRISASWAAEKVIQWGEGSAVYQNRVLGEFAADSAQTIIPLAWIEAANERWKFLQARIQDDPAALGSFTNVGVDVADGGEDDTVLALRYGDAIQELRRYPVGDTMETTGRVVAVLRGSSSEPSQAGQAIVDVIGIGAGVVARLRELGYIVDAFNAAERADSTDFSGELAFANRKAEAWWGLRERLDPARGSMLALPPDDLLTGDLAAPRWRISSGGKVVVESKDDLRKRIGRSTDAGDAVVMAFASRHRPAVIASASNMVLPRLGRRG